MVTRKLIRITSPEAAALAATGSSSSSSAAEEDSTQVNKQSTKLLTNDNSNETGGGKKQRALPSEDNEISGKETTTKRQRTDKFVIDLSDVPRQLPILKSEGQQKEGASKYTGVSFHKPAKKWRVTILIKGKQRFIGYYENEEEAAIDYARAVFKYKGQEALAKLREQNMSGLKISI